MQITKVESAGLPARAVVQLLRLSAHAPPPTHTIAHQPTHPLTHTTSNPYYILPASAEGQMLRLPRMGRFVAGSTSHAVATAIMPARQPVPSAVMYRDRSLSLPAVGVGVSKGKNEQ